MSWTISRVTSTAFNGWRAVAGLIVAVMLLLLGGGSAAAQSTDGIVGTWLTQVTLRNCQSNAPLGPPFFSLVTFNGDGTVGESAGGTTFAPGQRSPGHGSWTRVGAQTYAQSIVALVLFDTPAGYPVPPGGFLAGGQTITHTVTLLDPDHLTSVGTNAFYTSTLTQYRTGCSTATAQRFR
ncbi:MAG: hypothetical protein ABI880_08150 [Acidobacteriota bacterium]